MVDATPQRGKDVNELLQLRLGLKERGVVPHLDEVIQRRSAADPPGEPVPLAVADLETGVFVRKALRLLLSEKGG